MKSGPVSFSIVIPAKNEESNIGRCLDSITNIDFDKSDYEVIVVDNGSTDRTRDIAKQKGAKVYTVPDVSISALRNLGADNASGIFLVFVDADCTVESNWLIEASRYLSHSKIIAFGSPPVIPDNATWVQESWFLVRQADEDSQEAEWLESMNMFVRRTVFLDSGGFDERLVTCEDYDLSLRLKKHGLLTMDSRIVAVHHGEASTVRHFFSKEKWRGKGNIQGMKAHGVSFQELPSVVCPIFHGVAVLLFICAFVFSSYFLSAISWLVFSLWQLAILCMSVNKNKRKLKVLSVFKLYYLLNVYFTARLFAMIDWR